ncbi:polysaccharide biosynthesis protein [Gordonia sp. VNK21]|uniref:polysaccharide biosynthesis protein n=1 Tax=Gordonia sp. VNK21 TaxID=3382483 RepID=UPI0038D51477
MTATAPPDATAPDADTAIARNSLALAVSAAGTAVLGLVYWVVMGRLYPAAEVGAAAAVITAATMLASFGNLGLGAYFERFLPVAGPARGRIVRRGLTAGAGAGLLLGSIFVLVGPVDEMFSGRTELLLFPLFVVALSLFAMLDHLAVGLHRADWAAGNNIGHAVAKLAGAALLAGLAGRLAITGSWILTAVLAGAVIAVPVARRVRAAGMSGAAGELLPPGREQARFLAANYGVFVVTALAPLILPMVVIARVGADQNAYFALVWSLMSAVLVLQTMLTGPYVAAVAARPDRFTALSARFGAILGGVSVLACLALILLGPVVLALAGRDYAENGGRVLQTAAAALPLAACGAAYTALCRIRRRLLPALAVQLISAGLMLSLTLLWIDDHGVIAAAWALLAAEGTAAVLVTTPLVRAWRSSRTGTQSR